MIEANTWLGQWEPLWLFSVLVAELMVGAGTFLYVMKEYYYDFRKDTAKPVRRTRKKKVVVVVEDGQVRVAEAAKVFNDSFHNWAGKSAKSPLDDVLEELNYSESPKGSKDNTQAYLEGLQKGLSEGDKCTATSAQVAYEAGFNDAIEKAAKAAKEFPIPTGFHEVLEIHDNALKEMVAEQIRQLKPEVK